MTILSAALGGGLIGGAIGAIFAAMTLIYKQLIAPPEASK